MACGHRLVERAGVADARRAAVAGQGEAERLERRHQAGGLEIPGDRPRTGRQRGLDGRADTQAAGDGVAGQQPGPDHDRRVGRVRAGRDGGDRHRAMADGRGRPVQIDGDAAVVGRPGQAALVGQAAEVLLGRRRWRGGRECSPEVGRKPGQLDPVLGTPRPGDGRLDARQIELEQLVEDRPVARFAPQALGSRVAFDQRRPARRTARSGAGR